MAGISLAELIHDLYTDVYFRCHRSWFKMKQLILKNVKFLIKQPSYRASITECQIINWFVKPGDRVKQFDKICEVQSDKASVEITSRWDGTVRKLLYDTDDMAIVGQPLLEIDVEELEDEITLVESVDIGDAAEEIMRHKIQPRAGADPQEPQTPRNMVTETKSSPSHAIALQTSSETDSSLLIPSVRHLLKELNLNIRDIQGTGKNRRVTKEDVLRYNQELSPQILTVNNEVEPNFFPPSGKDQLLSPTATQNAMFKTMTSSLAIPHFLYTHSVDFTILNSLRQRFNTNSVNRMSPSSKLTPLPFIMKALSQAFNEYPLLNSHLQTPSNQGRPKVLIKNKHNFGIAIDTPNGLLVPVVKDVQSHSISSLAEEISRLSGLAKEGKLGVDDFKGATFVISNIGSVGGGVVSPVIVAPMVGILGVGRVRAVPAFERDEMGAEKIVKREEVVLSWSADHRLLDGATVAKCAEVVKVLLENVDVLAVVLK
ncbi:related to branched-chain alpha-keto acid dehydrogenase complex [Phialocephala subalpina]|uniref:Dihydrolipoamide acetyltransferase component of pyruvate dehydrogenase complex n=1 Tax=Phialocephala subalpina TaxID=576137 RepID=A0A1L7XYK7_9HELO|nr:related to branched-chain alpha-keto acid dehydrogenase complex [Phialocephala subalpina]